MTKTILIPVDVSQLDAAAAAVQFARDNMNLSDTKFVLFNVVERIPTYIAAEIPDIILGLAREESTRILTAFAAQEGLRESASAIVREGNPGREILEYAAEASPDFILISSHDPGLVDYILGSVAGYVVRHAHCSVVVVRNSAR